MSYREIPEDRILSFPSTAGFKGWKNYFTEDSITHPAKMNLNLLRHIIRTYTKAGDVILDPMAGTGSTIILAAIEGRHGIAVEYEEHFCKMIRENIKLTEKQSSFKPRGKMLCIQGDARELSKLLKKSDVIITSPPYSKSMSGRNPFSTWSEEVKRKWWSNYRSQGGGLSYEGFIKLMEKQQYSYSTDPRNIGNLKHGEIDTIITSPPYGSDNANLRERKDKSAQSVLASTGVRAVPLEEDNIGVLEYGDVDAILTSPPYQHGGSVYEGLGERVKRLYEEGKIDKETWEHFKGRKAYFEKAAKPYSKKIDSIITSPPYEGSYLGGGDQEARRKRLIEAGYDAESFFGGKARDTILKHYDEVDTIVSSPPYSEGLRHRGQDFEEVRKKLLAQGYDEKYIKGHWSSPHQCQRWAEEGYGEDEKNIGNLRHGEIDNIVTSPPYEGTARDSFKSPLITNPPRPQDIRQSSRKSPIDSYSNDPDNIGNLKSKSYLEAMLQCYREFYKVLKNSGKLILVTKNFIRDKQVVRLDEDTIKLCEASGFTLQDRWYFRLPQMSFWRILYHQKYPDVSKILYEDVLIFEKRI